MEIHWYVRIACFQLTWLHNCLAGPTKTSSFKQQQNISLNIDKPTDVPTPEEPPQVEVIQTPTAAQVEATFDKELKQLQNQK